MKGVYRSDRLNDFLTTVYPGASKQLLDDFFNVFNWGMQIGRKDEYTRIFCELVNLNDKWKEIIHDKSVRPNYEGILTKQVQALRQKNLQGDLQEVPPSEDVFLQALLPRIEQLSKEMAATREMVERQSTSDAELYEDKKFLKELIQELALHLQQDANYGERVWIKIQETLKKAHC